MAALTANSWTVRMLHATGVAQNANARQVDTAYVGKQKYVQAIMTLATGESPLAGVPWPDKGAFGFYQRLDNIIVSNSVGATGGAATASGGYVMWQMNVSGQRARGLKILNASGTGRTLIGLTSAITIKGGTTLYVTAVGW
jgi:hypothetical protein